MRLRTWLGCVLVLVTGVAGAEVRLPKVLSSHAVLQRERPLHVWGWADAGACVTVRFHEQTASPCADRLGQWSVYLQPEKAGGPYVLEVTDGTGGVARAEDVLVGDVWFASGQSNMEFPLEGFGPTTPLKDQAKEIAAATEPRLRLLHVPQAASAYPLDDEPATWTECTPETAKTFSAVAYFFGREIAQREKVPVGLIDASWGGTPIESWMSLGGIASDPGLMPLFASRSLFAQGMAEREATLAAEKRETEAAKAAGQPAPKFKWHPGAEGSWNPGYLFNGMVAPVTGTTVRGFLWYQGETNSDPERAGLYRRELPAMIADWRAQWGEGLLPFLYVQISNFESPRENWGEVRDAERRTLSVAQTAMAVTLDVGQRDNVHPPDKQTVGHRLALGARALAYGETKLEWSGPLVREAHPEGKDGVRVWFDHAEELRAAGGVAEGFEVAGEDGVWRAGTATVEGETVVVRGVAGPRQVRYGWASWTAANLSNGAGLPASTFGVEVR